MLELDDIQSGVLRPRPTPYAATYIVLRIDDRKAGRELMRRLSAVVTSAANPTSPLADTWVSVALTYTGLNALGVPQDSLDSFAWEFRQGMAARAKELGDTGESGPENWEKPFGTPDVHVVIVAVSPDTQRLEAALDRARKTYQEMRRDHSDLAAELPCAAHRKGAFRIQGRHQPSGDRRQRYSRHQSQGTASQGGRICSGLSRRDGRRPDDLSPRSWVATEPMSSSANCTSAWPRSASTLRRTPPALRMRNCWRRR